MVRKQRDGGLDLRTITFDEFKGAVQIVDDAIRNGDPNDEEGLVAVAMKQVPLLANVVLETANIDIMAADGLLDEDEAAIARHSASPAVQRTLLALYLIET